MSEKQFSLVPIGKGPITVEIPETVLHTYVKEFPTDGIPKKMRITHTFDQIDAAVRYAISVMLAGGYSEQSEFKGFGGWRGRHLERNPREEQRLYSLIDEDSTKPWWHEILISPLHHEHHERNLTLTVSQLGFSIGELQLWLEFQYKRALGIERQVEIENKRARDEFESEWLKTHHDKNNDNFWSAWTQYCYWHSPANYHRYKQPTEHGVSRWYNVYDFLEFDFFEGFGNYNDNWQFRYLFGENVAPHLESIWYFKSSRGTYCLYLFVHPEFELAPVRYVLSSKAQEMLDWSPGMYPRTHDFWKGRKEVESKQLSRNRIQDLLEDMRDKK